MIGSPESGFQKHPSIRLACSRRRGTHFYSADVNWGLLRASFCSWGSRKVETVNKSLNTNACNRTTARIRVTGETAGAAGSEAGSRAAVMGFTFWPVNVVFQVSCDQRLISILSLRSFPVFEETRVLERMDAVGREVYVVVLTASATASHVWGDVPSKLAAYTLRLTWNLLPWLMVVNWNLGGIIDWIHLRN